MNFQNSSSLADFQDKVFVRYQNSEGILTLKKELKQLESNLWIKTARFTAPSNLVIRHLILIDLIKEVSSNIDDILKLFDILSYNGKIWAEGYSYFLYVKYFLKEYASRFISEGSSVIMPQLQKIERTFQDTAYLRNGILYPAPFGDLRDIPLEKHLQNGREQKMFFISLLYKSENVYKINLTPIKLNTHIPIKSYNIRIIDGIPVGFKFYTGYDKKYNNSFQEVKDMFSLKRILSF